MISKGLILKTAAVVSAVSVLIITGCQGGIDEAAAVKNKGTVEVSVVEAKGESVNDIQRNGKEAVEAVDRSIRSEGQDAKKLNNDTERDEEKKDSDQHPDNKGEQPEAETGSAGEEDGGASEDDSNGQSDKSVLPIYESDSSAGWDGGMENDSSVSEYWDGDTVSEYDGYYDSGMDESGQPEYAGDYEDEYIYEDTGTVESGEESVEYAESDELEQYVTEDSLIYQGDFTVTFYDDCEECCGRAGATTASGVYPTAGHTIAADGYEFGTVLYIEGFGYYVVEDRGVPYGWIDIFVNDHSEVPSYGITTASVYLVN